MLERSPAPGWHVSHDMGCRYAYTIKQGSEVPQKKDLGIMSESEAFRWTWQRWALDILGWASWFSVPRTNRGVRFQALPVTFERIDNAVVIRCTPPYCIYRSLYPKDAVETSDPIEALVHAAIFMLQENLSDRSTPVEEPHCEAQQA